MVTFNGDDEILRFSCASCGYKEHIDIDPTNAEDLKKLGRWLLTHSEKGGKYDCVPAGFEDKCIRFHTVYQNLPIEERDNVCCTIDGEPISWKIARGYIITRCKISEKIVKALCDIELI